jgi:hypothetical protein
MSRRIWAAWGWFCQLILACPVLFAAEPPQPLVIQIAAAAKPMAIPRPREREAEQQILDAFKRTLTVDFRSMPLEEVARFIQDHCKIPVFLDSHSLADVGTSSSEPITFHAENISLRSILRRILRDLDLAYSIHQESLVITTVEQAERQAYVRVYPVDDLVEAFVSPADCGGDLQDLIELITATIQPTTWGHSSICESMTWAEIPGAKVLIVAQIHDVHQEISDLLDGLRRLARRTAATNREPMVFLPEPTPADMAIQKGSVPLIVKS